MKTPSPKEVLILISNLDLVPVVNGSRHPCDVSSQQNIEYDLTYRAELKDKREGRFRFEFNLDDKKRDRAESFEAFRTD